MKDQLGEHSLAGYTALAAIKILALFFLWLVLQSGSSFISDLITGDFWTYFMYVVHVAVIIIIGVTSKML